MTVRPGLDNHIILCEDGLIFDLLDVLVFQDDLDSTIARIVNEHKSIVKAVATPYKLFEEVVGLKKTGEFVRIGPTNWPNLFMIHNEFQYYLAYINIQGERKLVAKSMQGLFWRYNIIDLTNS